MIEVFKSGLRQGSAIPSKSSFFTFQIPKFLIECVIRIDDKNLKYLFHQVAKDWEMIFQFISANV